MPIALTMPKLSPTMEEGVIAKWHKKVGDRIEAGDLLLEVATDKATVEHHALDEGWLRKILVKEGEAAVVNDPIAVFTESEKESIEGFAQKKEEPKKAAAAPKKAAKEETPEQSAAQTYSQPAFTPEAALENYEFQFPTESTSGRTLSSPLARKLAKEKGLDIATVKGSGPQGRVTSDDLKNAQPEAEVPFTRRTLPTKKPGSFEEETLTPMRKVIAKRLQEAKSFVPHFYVQQTVNASALVEFREQLSNLGIKVSYNDIVIRASALALRKHPDVNSGFNSATNTLIRFQTIDISIAVSLKEGLITPIIRHADYKALNEISVEMRNLAKRAKEGKLQENEYKGGSFTVSNLGMYGTTSFQAIINPPQAAILAVGGILNVPVVRNGSVVPGKILNLTLSADHRVVDGVAAAEFLKTLQKFLENPVSLLI